MEAPPASEPDRTHGPRLVPPDRPLLISLGAAAWATIGIIAVGAVVVLGLAQVSSVVVSLLFAAVFAILFAPLTAAMTRRRIPTAVAAGIVLVGFVAIWVGIAAMTVRGVIDQGDRLVDEFSAALRRFDIDDVDISAIRQRIGSVGDSLGTGVMGSVTAGISAVGNALVGLLLGALALFYLLRDGPAWRRSIVEAVPEHQRDRLDAFIGDSVFVLRRYWLCPGIRAAGVPAPLARRPAPPGQKPCAGRTATSAWRISRVVSEATR